MKTITIDSDTETRQAPVVQRFAVWREIYGTMHLAEDGFLTHQASGEWAAQEYGLGNWEVRQYDVVLVD